jgi:hypothetical protein
MFQTYEYISMKLVWGGDRQNDRMTKLYTRFWEGENSSRTKIALK